MLVTIIIPVYKVEEYLDITMQSVFAQTYKDLEIIMVDDGSPDNCGKLCDEYAEKDPRIVVIHQENKGLSGARNAALDIMKGDAVTFVDSDDTIDPHYVEYMVDDMEKYDADIVECQMVDVYSDKNVVKDSLKEIKVCTPEEALEIDMGSRCGSVSACAKLYKRHIFNKHRFEVGKISEDAFAIINSLSQAKVIVIDPRSLYNYYHRDDSITTLKFNERSLDVLEVHRKNLKIVKKRFPGAINGALFRYDMSFLWVLDRILLDEDWKTNPHVKPIKKQIQKHLPRILRNPYFTKQRKAGAALAAVSVPLYRKALVAKWKGRVIS